MKQTNLWKSYGMFTLDELNEYEQQTKEYLIEDGYDKEEITDNMISNRIYNDIDLSFEDETINLNKQLNGRILAIADMGLWNGRRTGYKILGNNLNEVITCGIGCDEKEIYCDAYNVRARGYHHDGSNEVEFREIREDKDIEPLLEKIYNQEPFSRAEINRYTRSLRPYIKEIYGV